MVECIYPRVSFGVVRLCSGLVGVRSKVFLLLNGLLNEVNSLSDNIALGEIQLFGAPFKFLAVFFVKPNSEHRVFRAVALGTSHVLRHLITSFCRYNKYIIVATISQELSYFFLSVAELHGIMDLSAVRPLVESLALNSC